MVCAWAIAPSPYCYANQQLKLDLTIGIIQYILSHENLQVTARY